MYKLKKNVKAKRTEAQRKPDGKVGKAETSHGARRYYGHTGSVRVLPVGCSDLKNSDMQQIRFMKCVYDDVRQEHTWCEDAKNNIRCGILGALADLNKAGEYLQRKQNQNRTNKRATRSNFPIPGYLPDAVRKVANVLSSEGLVVFPLVDGSAYGKSAKGPYEISININITADTFNLKKTLIHEAFHIIGGCTDEGCDTTCPNDMERDTAFEEICCKESIETVSADCFAQFVIRCGQPECEE